MHIVFMQLNLRNKDTLIKTILGQIIVERGVLISGVVKYTNVALEID